MSLFFKLSRLHEKRPRGAPAEYPFQPGAFFCARYQPSGLVETTRKVRLPFVGDASGGSAERTPVRRTDPTVIMIGPPRPHPAEGPRSTWSHTAATVHDPVHVEDGGTPLGCTQSGNRYIGCRRYRR